MFVKINYLLITCLFCTTLYSASTVQAEIHTVTAEEKYAQEQRIKRQEDQKRQEENLRSAIAAKINNPFFDCMSTITTSKSTNRNCVRSSSKTNKISYSAKSVKVEDGKIIVYGHFCTSERNSSKYIKGIALDIVITDKNNIPLLHKWGKITNMDSTYNFGRENVFTAQYDYVHITEDHSFTLSEGDIVKLNSYNWIVTATVYYKDKDPNALDVKKLYNEYYNPTWNLIFKEKDYITAIEKLNKAINIKPEYPQAYNRIAYAYLGLQDYDNALASVNNAIKLNPKEGAYYDTRGEIYEAMGKYREALTEYNRAISINDNKELRAHKERLLKKFSLNTSKDSNNQAIKYDEEISLPIGTNFDLDMPEVTSYDCDSNYVKTVVVNNKEQHILNKLGDTIIYVNLKDKNETSRLTLLVHILTEAQFIAN